MEPNANPKAYIKVTVGDGIIFAMGYFDVPELWRLHRLLLHARDHARSVALRNNYTVGAAIVESALAEVGAI